MLFYGSSPFLYDERKTSACLIDLHVKEITYIVFYIRSNERDADHFNCCGQLLNEIQVGIINNMKKMSKSAINSQCPLPINRYQLRAWRLTNQKQLFRRICKGITETVVGHKYLCVLYTPSCCHL